MKFYGSLEEATGSVDDLSTVYGAIGDAGLSKYLGDPKTVATLFAPTDDVSISSSSSSSSSYCNTTCHASRHNSSSTAL